MRVIFLFLSMNILLLPTLSLADQAKANRWYSAEQVSAGKGLFAKYCSGCHGANGEGAPNHDKPLPNGSYPPQPLNGSGHSWHHSLADLEKTIELGGRHQGATMPEFGTVLNHDQRLSVIAAFQSLWSDKVYIAWRTRDGNKHSH